LKELNRKDEHETEKIQYIIAEIETEFPSLVKAKMAADKQKNSRIPDNNIIVAEFFKNG
jgi:hypothetical protein